MNQEKRKEPRQKLPVEVVVKFGPMSQICCQVKDLSTEGVCLDAGPSLPTGTIVDVALLTQGRQGMKCINTKGVVTHSSTEGTGVKFDQKIELLEFFLSSAESKNQQESGV
ncbi:MAG: PilZ domain-containing protein [Gammaproteobacteria bacterium]|nr:PilZ domain-containing protein [Gammaproteobacteria bacterium]